MDRVPCLGNRPSAPNTNALDSNSPSQDSRTEPSSTYDDQLHHRANSIAKRNDPQSSVPESSQCDYELPFISYNPPNYPTSNPSHPPNPDYIPQTLNYNASITPQIYPPSPGYTPLGHSYSAAPQIYPPSPNYTPQTPSLKPSSPRTPPPTPDCTPQSPDDTTYYPPTPDYSPQSPDDTTYYPPPFHLPSPALQLSPYYSPLSVLGYPPSPEYTPQSPPYSSTSPLSYPSSPDNPHSPLYSLSSPHYNPSSLDDGAQNSPQSPTSP